VNLQLRIVQIEARFDIDEARIFFISSLPRLA
jgi:hypothetical protein